MSGRHTDDDGNGVADFAEQRREVEERYATVRPMRAGAPGPLTGATMRAALAAVGAVGKQIKSFDELAAGAVDALRQAPAGLTSAGASAFLATAAVESAWFRTTTEYGSGQRYAPYIGRTFVQLTWRENYLGFGRWCKNKGLVADADTFANNPRSLSDFQWAWLGAVYYFEMHGLWRYANADNFLAVSQAVNGGDGRIGTSFTPNSWTERKAMYRVFLAANITPPSAKPAVETAKGLPEMIERQLVPGDNIGTIVCPVGTNTSALVKAAWVSVRCAGGVHGTVWFQRSADSDGPAPGAGTPFVVGAKSAARPWAAVPDGTEYLEYSLNASGPGSLLIELAPR